MQIVPIKTNVIKPNQARLVDVIDKHLPKIVDGSVLVISSKLVSLCEGSVANGDTDKDMLIRQSADLYIQRQHSKYNSMITITKNSLMLAAGIDESNADGVFVLWPIDPLATAKTIYMHVIKKCKLTRFGVVIADSTSRPLRIGTIGTCIAHWGFVELNDYRGKKDLFGKEMTLSQANVAEGLACAAVLAMGEGTEQTPLAVITDVPFIQFDTAAGGSCYNLPVGAYKDDVYEPIWNSVNWQTSGDD